MENLNGIKVILVHHRIDCEVFKINRQNIVDHDFTICFAGKMRYTIGEKTMCLSAGDAVYCPPGVHMKREEGDIASYLSINFTTPNNEPLPIGAHLLNVLSHEINSYIELISYLLRKPALHNDEKLHHLVVLTLLKAIEQQEFAHPMPYVERMKAYITENFRKDITLETVSEFINLHPSYCSTIFKKSEGKSVTEFINTMRINHAKELLETTSHRIGEIGTMSGISDPYYFSRVFNKIAGVSPSDYRKIAKAYGGKFFGYVSDEYETYTSDIYDDQTED